MLIIPFSDEPGTYKIFVVLEDANISRVKLYDPAQVPIPPAPAFENKRLKLIFVGYANADDQRRIADLAQEEDGIVKIMDLLNRGFSFQPEAGDYDGPPISIKATGEEKH